jgi:UDP-GlcNAc:undecaprenyl-phosphate GlcNAc-1-phosphate transferase
MSTRHIHKSPIPRLGGIAIYLTCVIISIVYWVAVRLGFVHHAKTLLIAIMIPATALFAVGLIDDLRGLKPLVKLLAQIAGGASLYFSGFRFEFLQTSNHHLTVCISFLVTIGFVVLLSNAINLIDGLDGLAAGAALFSMVTIFTFALANGRHGTALAVATLAGANLGFLVFNFNPASIFLGDSGSLCIGFCLSAVVLSESTKQSDPLRSILVPVIALALPLTDLVLTIIRRYLSGHSIFGADREHIHHKLLELGLSQRQVIAILYSVSASCAVLSLALMFPSRLIMIPVVAIFLLVLFFGIRHLNYKEFLEVERLVLRLKLQKQASASNIALRKSVAVIENSQTLPDIVDALEICLQSDFDGFRIILEPGHWFTIIADDEPTRVLEKSWSPHVQDKIVVTMDLIAPRYGKIGRLSIDRDASQRLLVDSWILQAELRHSLSLALQRCIITMPTDLSSNDTITVARRLARLRSN